MTNNRSYLIRAVHEWIVDNNLTPHILVNATYPLVEVPFEYVENGQIILNISPDACKGLLLGNDRVVFTATFAGVPHQIFLPPDSIMAIYAQENGKGMYLSKDDSSFNELEAKMTLADSSMPESTHTAREIPYKDEKPSTTKKVKLSLVKK